MATNCSLTKDTMATNKNEKSEHHASTRARTRAGKDTAHVATNRARHGIRSWSEGSTENPAPTAATKKLNLWRERTRRSWITSSGRRGTAEEAPAVAAVVVNIRAARSRSSSTSWRRTRNTVGRNSLPSGR
jgi:hypothetical protein